MKIASQGGLKIIFKKIRVFTAQETAHHFEKNPGKRVPTFLVNPLNLTGTHYLASFSEVIPRKETEKKLYLIVPLNNTKNVIKSQYPQKKSL